ncbi:MAG TPA: helicase-related protein, partial [Gemmatimonadales bacterium]|nr:helicase-related protein [Gemmatimonadales bacterium]
EVGHMEEVLVFTRTKHRADRVCKQLVKHGISAERIHGNRSQPQRTAALAGFKDGTYRVLVATDIVARGIDITALGHVLNLDVPVAPEDYIHRIGRTGRAAETGDAITFVAPDEEPELRAIERVLGRKVPRAKAEGFDYSARPAEKLEIPLEQRIAEIRARKAQERARAKEKAARKTEREATERDAATRRERSPGTPTTAGGAPKKKRRRRRGGAGRGPGGGGAAPAS